LFEQGVLNNMYVIVAVWEGGPQGPVCHRRWSCCQGDSTHVGSGQWKCHSAV